MIAIIKTSATGHFCRKSNCEIENWLKEEIALLFYCFVCICSCRMFLHSAWTIYFNLVLSQLWEMHFPCILLVIVLQKGHWGWCSQGKLLNFLSKLSLILDVTITSYRRWNQFFKAFLFNFLQVYRIEMLFFPQYCKNA